MKTRTPIATFTLVAFFALSAMSCRTLGGATIGGSIQRKSHELAKSLEESGELVRLSVLEDYVRAVGDRLVEQAESSPVDSYHFAVLDDPSLNAFSMPSGHVYISRGLLAVLNSEDELAGVLGHEIGHVLEQHSLEHATGSVAFLPIRLVTRIGGGLVGLALPRVGQVVKATGEIPAALTGASYGRGQENEADEVGQQLAAKGGWDPNALSRVMDALSREQEMRGQDPNASSWFATHPATPERAAKIRDRAIGQRVASANPVASSRTEFLSKLEGLVVGEGAREGIFDGSEFLHPELGFGVRFPEGPGWVRVNEASAVAVVRESPRAAVILEVVARGNDALAVARAFEPEAGKLDGPPRAETVNDLQTAYATGAEAARFGKDAVRASARWVAHGGVVYRILSESTETGYGLLAADFDAAERSFRALGPADHARIVEDRLAIETARADESLAGILERVGSEWGLEEASAANDVEPNDKLKAGEPIKVTRQVEYRSRP